MVRRLVECHLGPLSLFANLVPVSLTVKLETADQPGTNGFWDSAIRGQSDASLLPAKGSVQCRGEGA